MRYWMILLAALLLAACQQTGAGDKARLASGDTEAGGKRSLRYFEPEFVDLRAQMIDKLFSACMTHVSATDVMNKCLRDRFASAFDDSHLGRKNCDYHTELGDFIGCVAIGNTFIDVRRRLADNSPVPSGYWSGGHAMVDAVIQSMVARGTESCGKEGSTAEQTTCFDRWYEDRLQLPENLIDRCPEAAPGSGSERTDREGCLIEAIIIRFMQDHIPRLDAISA